MAKNEDQKFDPRFDPAFQRGFKQPRASSAERRSAPAARVRPEAAPAGPVERSANVVSSATIPPIAAREPEPALEHPPAGIREAESADSPIFTPNFSAAGLAEPDGDEGFAEIRGGMDDPQAAPRNPFFVALWIIGIAFTAGGLAILAASVYALVASSPIVAYDRTMDELGIYVSTPLMTVGLATIVGLLLVAGLRRSR